MKIAIIVTAFTIGLSAAALPGQAEILRGDRFVTAMQDNTVSGVAGNTAYNLYFLPGGIATYRDQTGSHVSGSWHLDQAGDVCVNWQKGTAAPAGCYQVTAESKTLSWQSKSAMTGGQTLRGGVTETFLQPAH